jgi:hypothetical protein
MSIWLNTQRDDFIQKTTDVATMAMEKWEMLSNGHWSIASNLLLLVLCRIMCS